MVFINGGESMTRKEWERRYKNRNDITLKLTHLTKEKDIEDTFANLLKILEEKKLKGSTTETGYIIGDTPAVCLQEAPLDAIAENLQYEKELRKDTNQFARYRAFGIRFNKCFIYENGGRPVIYESKDLMKEMLPIDQYWRMVNFDLSNKDHMLDWSHEREWRVPGDLNFRYTDIEVLLPSNRYY